MPATLFDHINQITNVQNPKYWDTLNESDQKSWSNYMIIRTLSMKSEWLEIIATVQSYIQELPPKSLYLLLINLLPKGKHYVKYIKPRSDNKYEQWLIDLVSKYYEVSKSQAADYLLILYSTKSGFDHIVELAERYGTDIKLIKKLKYIQKND